MATRKEVLAAQMTWAKLSRDVKGLAAICLANQERLKQIESKTIRGAKVFKPAIHAKLEEARLALLQAEQTISEAVVMESPEGASPTT